MDNMMILKALQWLTENINHKLKSQKTFHTSSSWVNFKVAIMNILEKNEYDINQKLNSH